MTTEEAEAAEIAELERKQAEAGQGPQGPAGTRQPQPQQTEPVQQQEPQQQAQRQTEAEDDNEEIEVENRGRFVRASALKAADERRKDAERRAQEVEAKYATDMARVTERLAMLVENGQRPQQQAEPQIVIPDLEKDPLGHFQAQFALASKRNEDLAKRIETFEQRGQRSDAMQNVSNEVTRLETEFARATPDYGDAMAHLRSTWLAEAEVAGVPADVAIRARALEIAQLASRSNRNPAELGYALAKARGYTKKAPNGQATNGAQSQNVVSIDTLQRGLATTRGTSGAPGRAAPGTPTLDALINMDDEEFAAKYVGRDNKNWKREASRLT